MTLEKAIELLTQLHKGYIPGKYQDDFAAMELGIEALKREKNWRQRAIDTKVQLLPSETE